MRAVIQQVQAVPKDELDEFSAARLPLVAAEQPMFLIAVSGDYQLVAAVLVSEDVEIEFDRAANRPV